MSDTFYWNLFVAITNVMVIPMIYIIPAYDNKIVLAISALCSFFMHLSETKHNLSGIYPYYKYAYSLLWIDRIMAFVAFFYFGYQIKWNNISSLSDTFMIGLICLFAAEVLEFGHLWFAIFHTGWHICAYWTAFEITRNVA